MEKMKVVNEERWLSRDLTDEEIIESAKSLASKRTALKHLESEKKSFVEQIKAKASQLESELDELNQRVSEGKAWGKIPCKVVTNYEEGTVTTTRLDTNEVLEERALRDTERQMEIPPEAPEPAEEADKSEGPDLDDLEFDGDGEGEEGEDVFGESEEDQS